VADGSGPATTAKQVIVMRKDLGMRKGKMIAQGAHASLKVLLDAGEIERSERGGEAPRGIDAAGARFTLPLDEALAAWLGGRFTKICVSVDSEAALDAVVDRARAAGVPCALVIDAGHTEFHGVPTKTCCAVGPAWSDAVDAITGGLPLL
jgi:peptidyl-tRNA hydrolase, PTH2 family